MESQLDLPSMLARETAWLHRLARALLHDEAAAADLAQDTAALALTKHPEFGGSSSRTRRWLRAVAERLALASRSEAHLRRVREAAAASPAEVRDALAQESIERLEVHELLVAAVKSLDEPYRSTLVMRFFEDLSSSEIARRKGLPAATVRQQLKRGLDILRGRLQKQFGDGEWRTALVGLLVPVSPWSTGLIGSVTLTAKKSWIGAIAMTTKTNIVAAAAVLLMIIGAFVFWPEAVDHEAPLVNQGNEQVAAAAEPEHLPSDDQQNSVLAEEPRRQPVAPPVSAVATTGTLVLHVRYGDDQDPAPDVTMMVRRTADFRFESMRNRTDAAGAVTFESLPPGRVYVYSDRGTAGELVRIKAGETTELDVELKTGLRIRGVVVDSSGSPVGGALVEVAPAGRSDFDVQVLATTGADGKFVVRGAPERCMVGARATRYAASTMHFLFGKNGNTADVRIELKKAGGVVDGIVVRSDGTPVPHAVVVVGAGRTVALLGSTKGGPPVPALVRSDEDGRFLAMGIPLGEQPVAARAVEFAPWQGKCNVATNTSTSLRITLTDGASLHGVVRDDTGAVVRKAEVSIGERYEFTHYLTHTADDGTFAFTGLPPGGVEVAADHDKLGSAIARVHTVAGATVDCDMRLSRGIELTGRVLDQNDWPVENLRIAASGLRPGNSEYWESRTRTDTHGQFTVVDCPKGTMLTVRARGPGIQSLQRLNVDPKAGRLELRVQRTLPPSAHIVGRVVGPDGKPVPNAMVSVRAEERHETPGIRPTGEDGGFKFGPLTPGTWSVQIDGTAYPKFTTDSRRLDAAATWRLGTVQLIQGGSAFVRTRGDTATEVLLHIVNAEETSRHYPEKSNSQWRTDALAPGQYRLMVKGKGTAAQAIPFWIRAGEVTKVEVRLVRGTAQGLEVETPSGTELKRGIWLRVLRGGKLVQRAWVSVRNGIPKPTELWLAPGSYEVTTTAGDLAGRAAFKVGQTRATPVRIALR